MEQKKTYFYFILAICFLAFNKSFAQSNNDTVDVVIKKDGKELKETIELPLSMTFPIDTLLSDWKVKKYIKIEQNCESAQQNPIFSDSIYIDRLSRIPAIMEMPYNEIIRRFIDVYNTRLRNKVAFMLTASNFYVPIFEQALSAYNLPIELKYLPFIESALNPSAVSRAGASGLWQFMFSTGKIYQLECNSLVDERRDPIKSSWAAARYLKDMYKIYNNWYLVIAAYNCGPGNVNKAIRRAGGAKDYWKIYNYLPRETRGYVPGFIAMNYVMNYYCDHNICPLDMDMPVNTDTIKIDKKIHFEQISKVCQIPVEEIRSLNPQYIRDIIPGQIKQYSLRLPQENIGKFIELEDSIYNYKREVYFGKRRAKVVPGNRRTYSSSGKKPIYHKIRSGESLSVIAEKYGVRVSSLKRWNNLRSSRITAGKRLKIYK